MRTAILAAALLAPLAARPDPGTVDWERGAVRCTGSGAANLAAAAGNPAVARIGAERAARLDALRNCLETLRGVTVESGRTVGSLLDSDAALAGRVSGLVKGFRVVGEPRYFSDGGVELDVEVPVNGALSDALLPAPAAAGPARAEAGAPGTSLVVDARDLAVVPALAPRILGPDGAELYGPGALRPEARRAGGAVAYARDLESARRELAARLGERPLVVKAVRAAGADVFLAEADAAALRGDPSFLAEGKVVFLTR